MKTTREIKKNFARFLDEMRADACKGGWDKTAVWAEIRETVDLSEAFRLTREERKALFGDDLERSNMVADELCDVLTSLVIAE